MDRLRKSGDSCGARITAVASNVPVGWGEPVYDKLDVGHRLRDDGNQCGQGRGNRRRLRRRLAERHGARRRDDAGRIPVQQCRRHPRRDFHRTGCRRQHRDQADFEHPPAAAFDRQGRRADRRRDHRSPRPLRGHSRHADRRSDAGAGADGPRAAPSRAKCRRESVDAENSGKLAGAASAGMPPARRTIPSPTRPDQSRHRVLVRAPRRGQRAGLASGCSAGLCCRHLRHRAGLLSSPTRANAGFSCSTAPISPCTKLVIRSSAFCSARMSLFMAALSRNCCSLSPLRFILVPSRDTVVCTVLAWLFQNFWNIARYMADARAQVLPLVGNGEHDWTEIFSRWGVLRRDTGIAGFVTSPGLARGADCLGLACTALVARSRTRTARRIGSFHVPRILLLPAFQLLFLVLRLHRRVRTVFRVVSEVAGILGLPDRRAACRQSGGAHLRTEHLGLAVRPLPCARPVDSSDRGGYGCDVCRVSSSTEGRLDVHGASGTEHVLVRGAAAGGVSHAQPGGPRVGTYGRIRLWGSVGFVGCGCGGRVSARLLRNRRACADGADRCWC